MRRPGYRQFDRVQTIMEADAALRRCLGPKTHSVKKKTGVEMKFSPEAVTVAEAFFNENRDAAVMTKKAIQKMAHKEILMKRHNTSPGLAMPPPPVATDFVRSLTQIEAINSEAKGTEAEVQETALAAGKPDQGSKEPAFVHEKPPFRLPDTLEEFSVEIERRVQNQAGQFVVETVAIGEAFLAATRKYKKNLKELAAGTGLAYATVTQYAKVAERFGSGNLSWARAQLPPSVDSLMRLSRIEPDQLNDAIKAGKVKPNMGRKEVKAVLDEYRPVSPRSSRSTDSAKADSPFASSLKAARKRLTAFQEAVEECQQFSDSHEHLILLLEDYADWAKDRIEKLKRTTET
jgi:hypothetical protein